MLPRFHEIIYLNFSRDHQPFLPNLSSLFSKYHRQILPNKGLVSPVVFFVLLKDSLNTVNVATLLFTLATKLASTSVEGF
ncbi:hypothetical protein [Pelosinus baikalensis]|uniref:hypothetical protein n=1 Tax=Pelosinus baikalensis TaxID=2892015 RepID=UPI001E42742F|nr:hypothetical protein [Pelosinus baikalensis]